MAICLLITHIMNKSRSQIEYYTCQVRQRTIGHTSSYKNTVQVCTLRACTIQTCIRTIIQLYLSHMSRILRNLRFNSFFLEYQQSWQ